MAPHAAHMDRAYDVFGALIHAFYHSKIVDNLFFFEDPEPEVRAGLVSILAGDVWRDDNRFQNALVGGRRSRDHRAFQAPDRPGGVRAAGAGGPRSPTQESVSIDKE